MLTLPRTITEKIHSSDGWIVLIINGIAITLFICLLVVLLKKHKVANYYKYMEEPMESGYPNLLDCSWWCTL